MKINIWTIVVLLVALGAYAVGYGQAGSQAAQDGANKMKRVGMVIGMLPEKIEEYKALHADSNAGVRDLLTTAHMKNFSIFLHQFDDGKYYLFGYYEYDGDDFEADMAALDAKDRNKEWLKMCDPMQMPFKGQAGWSEMERVYYNE